MNRDRPDLRLIPLFVLMLLHVVGLLVLCQWPYGLWPVTLIGGQLRIASGLVHGEVAVLAAWAAWSRMTFSLRLPLAMLGSMLAGFALVNVMDSGTSYVHIEVRVMTVGSALVQCLIILGMCQAARAFGIDWLHVRSGEIPPRRRAQFHLWELLTLMAAFALFLGGLRLIWPDDDVFDWQEISEQSWLMAGVLVVGNLLLANTVVTIYWIPRGWLKNLAITLGIAATITLLEWSAASSLDLRRSIYMFAWMNGTCMSWLLMSLALVRLAGYRLERVRFPKWTRWKGSGGVFAVSDGNPG